MQAEAFLRRVLETYSNKPLTLVKEDNGTGSLRSLNLKWKHVTFGMRNRIERWFGILEARTKCFSNTSQTTQPSKASKPSQKRSEHGTTHYSKQKLDNIF